MGVDATCHIERLQTRRTFCESSQEYIGLREWGQPYATLWSFVCDLGRSEPGYSALIGEIAPGWEIIQALFITTERDDNGFYIVADDEFGVYGYGRTSKAAERDYIDSLIEYYEIVESQADFNLGNRMLFDHLRKYIHKQY